MTVPKLQRNDQPLEVLTLAYGLLDPAVSKADNDKVIPKRHRQTLGNMLVKTALDAASAIGLANDCRLDDPEEARQRARLQADARRSLHAHLAMVEVLHIRHRLMDRPFEYWANLVCALCGKLDAWRASDRSRMDKAGHG